MTDLRHIANTLLRLLHIRRRLFIRRGVTAPQPVSIAYAITVCNEAEQLERLLTFLAPYVREEDEIIVQADADKTTPDVRTIIAAHRGQITHYEEWPLRYDFAQSKNHLSRLCHSDYIFQLDADEMPMPNLMEQLAAILTANPDIELFKLPRINLFDTQDLHAERTAWPDYQGRLYRNTPRICWHRPLHERIHGHKAYTYLPAEDAYAILHCKSRAEDNGKWQEWYQHYPERTR